MDDRSLTYRFLSVFQQKNIGIINSNCSTQNYSTRYYSCSCTGLNIIGDLNLDFNFCYICKYYEHFQNTIYTLKTKQILRTKQAFDTIQN